MSRPLRVGIFVIMAGREAGGPETYERGLVQSLASLGGGHEYHVFCPSRVGTRSFEVAGDNVRFHVLRPSIRWLSVPVALPLGVLAARIDALHATFVPPLFSPRPCVFSMHDVSMFDHPEWFTKSQLWPLQRLIRRGLRSARLIVFGSTDARDRTAERFGIPADRMAVVHYGVGAEFRPAPLGHAREVLETTYGIRPPYVLFVGKLMTRKNIVRLLEAFRQFRSEVKTDVKLVLVGKRTWTSEVLDDAIRRLDLKPHVVEVGYARPEHVPAFYSAAEMLAFPSLCEGFGFPVLEAMACGTPVVTSTISSLPEVAGDAAVLVDPYSVEEIAGGMLRVFSDGALRDTLRARGLRRAQEFTWRRTAEGTLAAYARVAAS